MENNNLLNNIVNSSSAVDRAPENPAGNSAAKCTGRLGVEDVPPPMTAIPGKKHTSQVPALKNQEVVLQGQIMPEKDAHRLIRVLYGSSQAGFASLLLLSILLVADKLESVAAWRALVIANVAVASLCVLLMVSCTVWYVIGVFHVARNGYKWSKRQWRHACMDLVQFISHSLNCIMYLAPNVGVLVSTGEKVNVTYLAWMLFIRFSMWNNIFFIIMLRARLLNPWINTKNQPEGERKDSLMIDAPLKKHWYLVIPWLAFESVLILYLVLGLQEREEYAARGVDISNENFLCKDNTAESIAVTSIGIGLAIHQMIGFIWCYKGYKKLTKLPYNLYRWTNIGLRYHIQHTRTIGDIVALSFIIMLWLKEDSCADGIIVYFGLLPAQFLMTAQCVINCIITTPVVGDKYSAIDIDPNRFLWLESPITANNSTLDLIDHTPMFCFETALKTWYWSLGAYHYDVERKNFTASDQELSMDLALQMYDLTNHEYIVESDFDSHVLIAWSSQTVLVCFRGTSSFTNVVADTKVWRTIYPPKQDVRLPGTQSAVHTGFIESWTSNGLNERVIAKVIDILSAEGFDKRSSKVIISGHSLGGALAVLAAYDIALKCGLFKQQILCYTFGAPRVGNIAFATDYDSHVPNTWQVINDNDVVPKIPRFGMLYRHVGRKVIINQVGDLIVRPQAVEIALESMVNIFKRSDSISQHLLGKYRASFVSICEAQFVKGKGLGGGVDAVIAILNKRDQLLSSVLGVSSNELIRLKTLGSTIWTTERNGLPEEWR